ncbi:MAG: hypothetical protein V4557_19290 [Bacteroidota bacterium]
MLLLSDISVRFMQGAYLLDNAVTRTIARWLDPGSLLTGVLIMLVAIALTVTTIYLYLFYKKRNFFYTDRIRKLLETWITQIIMEEEPESISTSKSFYKILNNRVARQFAIDELIVCKKNFSGAVAENITAIYIQLGLKKYSLKKLATQNQWHIRAKGIQELYLMDQADVLTTIYKNTNSKNEFVRMEAQTGVIHLTGFPGLRFLDVISYPLTEWQQLKLLEQLRLYPKKEDISEKIPGWLQSKNETVVIFALKLADEYQQFSIRKQVIDCLVHPQKPVRRQAIKTLITLADESTPAILLGYFNKEIFSNQVFILEALRTIATENEYEFLLNLLDHENDTIKLKAAVVLAEISENGLAVLEKRGESQPEPYQRIYRHVKTVK